MRKISKHNNVSLYSAIILFCIGFYLSSSAQPTTKMIPIFQLNHVDICVDSNTFNSLLKNTFLEDSLLSSFYLILTSTATAQINQGQFLVGGSTNFESVKNDGVGVVNYKTRTFSLSPNIGYFIIPKFAGGLRLNFSTYKQTITLNYRQTNISFSPFLRYYLLPQKEKFNVLVDAGYIHSKSKSRIPNYFTAIEERKNGYTVSVGPSVFLNEHVALEFLLGYKRTKVKNVDENKTTTLSPSLGLQIHLGKINVKGRVQ